MVAPNAHAKNSLRKFEVIARDHTVPYEFNTARAKNEAAHCIGSPALIRCFDTSIPVTHTHRKNDDTRTAILKAFIDGYREGHAARLLTSTHHPIALIAEMSGFANRTSFNEQFRSRYKMTPSEYRRAAKE